MKKKKLKSVVLFSAIFTICGLSKSANSAEVGDSVMAIEANWLFQANGNPTKLRTTQEIEYAYDLIKRFQKVDKNIDFKTELTQLSELKSQAEKLDDNKTQYIEYRDLLKSFKDDLQTKQLVLKEAEKLIDENAIDKIKILKEQSNEMYNENNSFMHMVIKPVKDSITTAHNKIAILTNDIKNKKADIDKLSSATKQLKELEAEYYAIGIGKN